MQVRFGMARLLRRKDDKDPCDMHGQSPIGGLLFVPFILNTRELAVAKRFFVNLGLRFLSSLVYTWSSMSGFVMMSARIFERSWIQG
jgi:hypothetical protein